MDAPFFVALLSWLGSAAATIGGWIAAKWGYKVALIALVGGVFLAIWAGVLAVLAGLASAFPAATGLPALALAALPDKSSVAAAASIYFGTALTMRSIDYWRRWLDVSATMASF